MGAPGGGMAQPGMGGMEEDPSMQNAAPFSPPGDGGNQESDENKTPTSEQKLKTLKTIYDKVILTEGISSPKARTLARSIKRYKNSESMLTE